MKEKVYEANPDPSKPKFFITAAFPYPNSPLHLGHARTYTIADVYARYMRMKGYNVLFPMGFHYTGTPILTIAEQIKAKDLELISLFMEVYDVPPKDIEKLGEPLALARYFHNDAKQAMVEMGYSIDWRREFTTIDEEFKKFIIWQFTKLKEKGLLTRGTHPVGWCPNHNMPVGMHDTKGDVEPEIGEFTLILFRLEGDDEVYLPAATLRPETVFGVTNIWLNPNAQYVIVEVDGRKWLVTERAAFKLGFQRKNIKIVDKVDVGKLFGKRVVNPATNKRVPILPGVFVDPNMATGVVMSVPAHAPYDYAALKDILSQHEMLRKYGVNPRELEPIPLIKVKGYSDVPAKDVVEKFDVKSQLDKDRLDEATKKLYSDEYHYGVMRKDIVSLVYPDIPPEYRRYVVAPVKAWIAGKPVSEAREATVKWLEALGYVDKMYEIVNRPVYCRCGTEVVVKVLEDQWFIDYGNPEWKAKAKELLLEMSIIPEEIRKEFMYTIDWLHERAAARTRGLGTELPWARGWIIESLSDSTIYMIFYTVNYKIRRYGLRPEQLGVEFWDYVVLGKGDPEYIEKKYGIPRRVLEDIKSEFEYWYPLDSRHSGRDLVPNHLTFFIFNHVALLPREKWPRQIVVNGFVMLEGKKMSKSLRNIIPLRRAIRIYGPDTVRAAILASAELLQDANFTHELALSVMDRLNDIVRIVEMVADKNQLEDDRSIAGRWIMSMASRRIKEVTSYMEEFRYRAATVTLLYEMVKDVEKYFDLKGVAKGTRQLRFFVENWVKMLAPIVPHIAEELWHRLGNTTLVVVEKWPKPLQRDAVAELTVAYVDKLVEDIKEIIRVVKRKPEKIIVAVDEPASWQFVVKAVQATLNKLSFREFMNEVVRELPKDERRRVAPRLRKLFEYVMGLHEDVKKLIVTINEFDEKSAIEQLKDYIARSVGINENSIIVLSASEAKGVIPSQKLASIMPLRPAIVVS
ncbi:MAG TPA: leucine--tRNA ligase [Pyrodictium sp.]|nr:leucine--tRNA ligase [Pyrodictium sp.]